MARDAARAASNSLRASRSLTWALLVIATAQLMMVLDDTVANVALPSVQADLEVSEAALPWVINAYVLAFGGLLLLGGRAGDVFGRRRVLRTGLVVFTVASVVGGLAPGIELLVIARAVQGVGAALVAPNALALIATTFPEGKPRNKAVAVYGAMSALGIIGGVLLGGVLTSALSWRWVLLVNLPIGVAVLAGTRVLRDAPRGTSRVDVLSAVGATGSFAALAYGFTRAGASGWTDPVTLVAFGVAVLLLVAFIARQSISSSPLLPLRLLTDRNRAGAYVGVLIIGAGLMGTFYLATLFMQQVLQFGPFQAGVAALPFGFGIVIASAVAAKLAGKLPPRAVSVPGFVLAAGGAFWLSSLESGSSYLDHLMIPLFLCSAGLGLAFVPMTLTVVHGVVERETGVASAVMNTAQQIGAALGLAVLTVVATTASAAGSADRATADALSDGYAAAYLAAAVMFLAGAIITALTVTTRNHQGTRAPSA
ncbi:MFS transporter [Cellulomonas sp. IC4_254]|uniref:MFS transporter n=1 Tax=Cellulomonas sp. IC4_254 TaxID=2714040 RepID=UPI00141F308A|nr:MFS transporter [Cellulomonas sp. IC4_254]NHT16090.1 MFS transporter [Cellulomonas sp. IC4_254]